MALDHGILNVPLSKRGNIDREIDKYQADAKRLESAQHKQWRKEFRLAVAEAVGLVERMPEARLLELGKPHRLTAKQVKAQLMSLARTRPTTTISVLTTEDDAGQQPMTTISNPTPELTGAAVAPNPAAGTMRHPVERIVRWRR